MLKINTGTGPRRDCIAALRNTDFHTTVRWPPNSLDLKPVDYCVWGVLQDRVYRRG